MTLMKLGTDDFVSALQFIPVGLRSGPCAALMGLVCASHAGTGLGPSVIVKGNLNPTAFKDIGENS